MQVAYKAHEWLVKLYHHILKHTEEGKQAYEYLKGRGISDETIDAFELGYAVSDSKVMISVLNNKGYSEQDLINRKIVYVSQAGNYYDPFYDRVVFPIYDFDDRPCAFGGRSMNRENKIKYLNSAETRIYKKQDNLYGFKQAKGSVQDEGYLVLFEGFFDVLQAHQNGVKNCVASLGTALTVEQALLIKSITNNVIIVYDADSAGVNASFRSASILEEVGVTVLIGQLDDDLDPDDYFMIHKDKERFIDEVVKTAIERKDFFVNQKIASIDINNPNERFSLLNEMLANLPADPTERHCWLQLINEKLNVPTKAILNVIKTGA